MKKSILVLLTLIWILPLSHAQDPSAVFDIESDDKGILIPRTDTAAINAAVSPATGLLIFQTTDKRFYFHDGVRWIKLEVAGGIGGVFENASGLVRNTGNHGTDDFVFGSAGIQGTSDTMFLFNKGKGAFRAGIITNPNWQQDSTGSASFAAGYRTKAKGAYSTAFGRSSQATATTTTAMGYETMASGAYATSFGYQSEASGKYATTFGRGTQAPSGYEVVIGRYNDRYTPLSPAGWNNNDRLFSVGTGTGTTNGENALTILKNGNVGIGTTTPDEALHVEGNSLCEGDLYIQNGSVGIGTINPQHIFHIAQNIGIDGANMEIQNLNNSTNAYNGIRFRNGTTSNTSKGGIFYQDKLSYGRGDLILANNSAGTDGNVTPDDARLVIKNQEEVEVKSDLILHSAGAARKVQFEAGSGKEAIEFYDQAVKKAEIGYDFANDYLYFDKNGKAYVLDGDVYAEGNYKFAGGAKTFYKQIPVSQFILSNSQDDDKIKWEGYYSHNASAFAAGNDDYWNMTASVSLPDGAVVTEFRIYYSLDDASISADMFKWEVPDPTGFTSPVSMATCNDSGTGTWVSLSDTSINSPHINNEDAQYYIYVNCQQNGDFTANHFGGARIKYTMTQLNP